LASPRLRVHARLALGKVAEARGTMAAFHRKMPDKPVGLAGNVVIAFATGDYDSTIAIARTVASRARGVWQRFGLTNSRTHTVTEHPIHRRHHPGEAIDLVGM
jgi:hypothetical protein